MQKDRSTTTVTLAIVAALIAGFVLPTTAASGSSDLQIARTDRDWELPVVEPAGTHAGITAGTVVTDPHGLVPKHPFVKRYSLDADHFEVWLCGPVVHDLDDVIAQLEAAAINYFDALSGGRYAPTFSAGGSLPHDASCVGGFFGENPQYVPVGNPESLLIVDSVTGGGFATPGPICSGDSADCPFIATTFPENGRYAIVGENALFAYPAVAVHEMGHTLQWPHSFSGLTTYEYDNPIDVMSANSTTLGTRYTEPLPYATLSYNRYQSGWVSSDDVVVAGTNNQMVTLEPFDVAGTQVLAVKTDIDGQFYVFGARKSSSFDPIPASWEGVEVYFVDHNCGHPLFGTICPGLFREHHQEPRSEYQIDHVMVPGDSIELEGITIAVVGETSTGFDLAINPGGEPATDSGTFFDDDGSIFEEDIEWLAVTGITAGCNPPHNTLFCPDESITRAQMAAFLVRALSLSGGVPDRFTDDDGSIFELDIEALAAAGITAGCNPPLSDRFCPNDPVSRAQMAAFLGRAVGLPSGGSVVDFVDDDDSIFESDIEQLAAVGITVGCNPPAGDRYCPKEPVTRAQMAAFLRRAFDS